jgi:HEAT repeat protein
MSRQMFSIALLCGGLALSQALCCGAEPDDVRLLALIRQLKDADPAVRGKSILAIDRLGPEARDATPELITALRDQESTPGVYSSLGNTSNRDKAFRALLEIGLEAIPALTTATSDSDAEVRQYSIDCLARFGPKARTALDRLREIALGPYKNNRYNALSALSQIDINGSIALPVLEQTIKSELTEPGFNSIQSYATTQLERYPNDPRAIKILLWAVKSPDVHIRGAAANALTRSDKPSEEIVAAVFPLLHDRTQVTFVEISSTSGFVYTKEVVQLATVVLANQKVSGLKVIPELLNEFQKPGLGRILWDLTRFEPAPPGIATQILEFYERVVKARREKVSPELNEYDLTPELNAVQVLTRFPDQLREHAAKIEKLETSTDEYQQFEAAILLAFIDPVKYHAQLRRVEEVLELADSDGFGGTEPEIQELRAARFPKGWFPLAAQIAVRSLLSNRELLERFLPKLKEWTEKDLIDWSDRCFQARLRELGPKAVGAGQVLVYSLNEPLFYPQRLDTLLALGPDVVPLLIASAEGWHKPAEDKLKSDANSDEIEIGHGLAPDALILLPRFGDAAVQAGPLLRRFAASTIPADREEALNAMSQIPGLRDQALSEIIFALDDTKCRVRVAADSSLGRYTNKAAKEQIIESLLPAMNDKFADVRAAALESLLKLEPENPLVQQALERARKDRHPYVRRIAEERFIGAQPGHGK